MVLTGMEANLRFAGPRQMETKIFGRLTAWQNWIFQRPNAARRRGRTQTLRHRREGQFQPERLESVSGEMVSGEIWLAFGERMTFQRL
jgi:hypothetical protein